MFGALALEPSTVIGGVVVALVLTGLRFGDALVDHFFRPSSADAIADAVVDQDG